jgi:polar amino acid transport system permease protein
VSRLHQLQRRAPAGSADPSVPPPQPDGRVAITRLVNPRRPGRWLATLIVAVAGGGILWSIGRNHNLQWHVIGRYLFSGLILHGVVVTCYLTIMSIVIGFAGGAVLAIMRLSANPVLRFIATVYVVVFRGIPTLVQIIFWGYLGAFYRHILIGIPFTHVTFIRLDTNAVVGATTAAILALGLNEIAYASEILRGGILGVDRQQIEAAYSLGLKPLQTTRRVVIPQAMRSVIPPLGNEVISVLKITSLVSVISGSDLMTQVQNVYAQNYEVIPLLAVASIWYLAVTTALTVPQRWLERYYGRGHADLQRRA